VNEATTPADGPETGAIHVRRIRADEGAQLKALRLRALAEEPEAFGESVADAEMRDEAAYVARARAASDGDRRAWFLAELAPETGSAAEHVAVGLAMGRRRPPDTCMVFSVWVAGTARGRGVGRALVDAIAGWARSWAATTLVLWVYRSNESAIRFYERLGFMVQWDGPDAELGAPHDALAMVRGVEG
jgi:ribosomal protein S18 acetylase RimI-like enzyme